MPDANNEANFFINGKSGSLSSFDRHTAIIHDEISASFSFYRADAASAGANLSLSVP